MGCAYASGRHNNGMHPTRDTAFLICFKLVGGRVRSGVRRLQ
ncbi:MAG: hypothetical protein QOC99_3160 [Acidobacteriota bacterium]|jgi:hypothetical protein|nr:hypothetical protein [Acidobacteriota bacterium]